MKKQPTTPLEDWITTAEAAHIMGVTQRHVIHLVSREQIEGKKITDRLILVNRQSVEAWTPKRRKRKEKSID
jgi:excisionase family DNA binding protein